ncbi:MAG: transglutaminase-like domain-containing protein [Sedimentibacter sp.]|uniref:transglutaminase-like domain-containing protein n=1 Tax=Sedimentibacter sp. TaxID=1960295 RepID=UPI0031592EFB
MKHKIPKSSHGIHLDNPSLIESKTSLVMQFLFYFLFLFLGVSGVYGCFYTTFTLPLTLQVFVFYAAVFCAVFTIMFLIKPRRILLLVLSLTAAVYVLFINRNLIDVLINHLTQGYFLTYNSVISAYAQKIQSSLFTFPTSPTGTNEITASSTAFAVFTLFFFTLFMAWMLVYRKSTLWCFMITSPFLGVSVFFGIIPHYAAVGALYIFWAFLILNSSFLRINSKFNKKKGVFYGGGNTAENPQSLIFLPVLTACLMLVTVIFPMNSFKRSDFVKDLRLSILSVPKIQSPIQIPIQSILGYTDRVNLQLMGNITFTGKTVLRVKSSGTEGDYLKGFVGSIYTGQSWDSLPSKEYEKLDSVLNEWKVQNFSSLFNKLLGRPVKTYDMTVQNAKRNSLRVYAPYGLVSGPEELPGIDFINDGFLRSGNVLFGTSEYSMKATTLQIDAWKISESMINAFSPEQAPFIHASIVYKNFVYSHYTQLPETLEERLDQYLREHNLRIENYFNINAFANAVITHVQSENSYTLSPGMTPEGRDFVEYFLFENHKGYCVHFASAAAALLRSAGVPARYVEGYAVSPDDFKENAEWANIPDSRSHAWVEIYLSAVGWVPVEATPGSNRGVTNHAAAEAETSYVINPMQDDVTNDKFYNHETLKIEELPDYENINSSSGEMQSSTTDYLTDAIMRILPFLEAFALSTAVLLSSRKLQIAFRKKQFTQKDSNKAAIAVYDYIVKLYAYAKPKVTAECRFPKNLYNLVLKARFSQHVLTEQELETLLVYAEDQALDIQKTVSLFKRFIGKYVYVMFK